MKFAEQVVLHTLLTKGIVATMRNGRYNFHLGREVDIRDFKDNIVGKARIIAVFENYSIFRKLLLKYSGFKTVEEWEERARNLNNGKLPRYIVLLRLVKKYIDDPIYTFESVDEFLSATLGEG